MGRVQRAVHVLLSVSQLLKGRAQSMCIMPVITGETRHSCVSIRVAQLTANIALLRLCHGGTYQRRP
jgi:hypothetical protein